MKFRFSLLHQSASYWLVLGLFFGANAWSWLRYRVVHPECCDPITTVGFPFPFLLRDAIAGSNELLVFGLLLDIAIAWTLAVAAAWLALSLQGKSDGASS
ncbi:MAG: hypothetical protein HKN35_04970 [Woeseia sp.]|nr:hypothetical protein [Woeseia sp.]MBT8096192.1 hypothetical protein [Woeseia sp.]NNE60221.1 hypothetical protein [Woeseia sp.]NNL56073.1 hypothetical protein [Woeseia sp.]